MIKRRLAAALRSLTCISRDEEGQRRFWSRFWLMRLPNCDLCLLCRLSLFLRDNRSLQPPFSSHWTLGELLSHSPAAFLPLALYWRTSHDGFFLIGSLLRQRTKSVWQNLSNILKAGPTPCNRYLMDIAWDFYRSWILKRYVDNLTKFREFQVIYIWTRLLTFSCKWTPNISKIPDFDVNLL